MKRLRLAVLTPQETVVSEDVDEVIVPLSDGWLGILPGHLPFVARLTPGDVIVRTEDKRRLLATIGGILTVGDGTATILTGAARDNCELEQLEREIGNETQQLAAMETEAERHFDRVLRQAASTVTRTRRRDA